MPVVRPALALDTEEVMHAIRQELNKLAVLNAAVDAADGAARDKLRSEAVAQAIRVNEMLSSRQQAADPLGNTGIFAEFFGRGR